MLKFILFPLSCLAVLLMAGCTTPLPPGAEPGPNGTMAYSVLIEASAPGAKIEADGNYIGEAPLTFKIYGDPDGTFHDFGSPSYIIRALPVSTNQYAQTRFFLTGERLSSQNKIPQRIYFDMNQPEPIAVPLPAYADPSPQFYFGTGVYVGPSYYYRRYGHGGHYGGRYYHNGGRHGGHGHGGGH